MTKEVSRLRFKVGLMTEEERAFMVAILVSAESNTLGDDRDPRNDLFRIVSMVGLRPAYAEQLTWGWVNQGWFKRGIAWYNGKLTKDGERVAQFLKDIVDGEEEKDYKKLNRQAKKRTRCGTGVEGRRRKDIVDGEEGD